jgi:hypothetical protein
MIILCISSHSGSSEQLQWKMNKSKPITLQPAGSRQYLFPLIQIKSHDESILLSKYDLLNAQNRHAISCGINTNPLQLIGLVLHLRDSSASHAATPATPHRNRKVIPSPYPP